MTEATARRSESAKRGTDLEPADEREPGTGQDRGGARDRATGQDRGGARDRATGQGRVADQERIAGRLLRSTAARSYDPELDINWAAQPEPDKVFLPPHRSSLYGTSLYERLSPQQRRELGKHEAASVAGTGIWLEFILLRLLAKLAYHGDPASRHVQYALAEMAEECRHSTMFARLIEWMGTPYYRPPRLVQRLGKMLQHLPEPLDQPGRPVIRGRSEEH